MHAAAATSGAVLDASYLPSTAAIVAAKNLDVCACIRRMSKNMHSEFSTVRYAVFLPNAEGCVVGLIGSQFVHQT